MPKKQKPPELSPQVWKIYRFVQSVKEGKIAATDRDTIAGTDLEHTLAESDLNAVVEMLEAILRGDDPEAVFDLPDGNQRRSTYERTARIAIAVRRYYENNQPCKIDDAIEAIREKTKKRHPELTKDYLLAAYQMHRKHAKKFLELERVIT